MLNVPYKLEEIAFIDIETTGEEAIYTRLSDPKQAAVKYITDRLDSEDENNRPGNWFYNNAALYPEFGQIVTISFGFFINGKFRVKAYTGNEVDILTEFLSDFEKASSKIKFLCGHNIKKFDAPFIIKRCIVHKIKLPQIFQIAGAKPWEVFFIDTMELWKNGSWSNTNLAVLTACLGIPTPKDDISGKEVHKTYWDNKEGCVRRIAIYCNKDVISTARVYQVMVGLEYVKDEDITEFLGNEQLKSTGTD